jgi:hypothetical protein
MPDGPLVCLAEVFSGQTLQGNPNVAKILANGEA